MNSFFSDFFSMSKLSASATPFVPVTQLLQQFSSLVEQLKIKLKFVDMQFLSALQKQATDMFSSSVPISQIPLHTPLSSKNDRNLKRYLRSKAWRDRQREIVHTVPASRSSRNSRSNFIKYLQDYKKGKFQSAHYIIPNSKEGGVMNSQLAVPSSTILNSLSTLPSPDNPALMDISVKSGVMITSTAPRVLYLPRNPPIPRLPSISTSSLFRPTIVLDEIQIPAWPSHYSRVFKLFHLSSFTENGCVFPKSNISYFDIADKISAQDMNLEVTDYFEYSRFHCILDFCVKYLRCCGFCGLSSCENHYVCMNPCSDCSSPDHRFHSCPKFLSWLHNPKTTYHSKWLRLVKKWILRYPPPAFKD